MFGWRKLPLTIASFALAVPLAAAQTTTFDGHYAGASAHATKSTPSQRKCPRESTPDSLSIANGVVHSTGHDRWAGTVSPDGSLVIRNRRHMRVSGQIDPQGTISGEYHGPACIVAYVWHKQSG